MNSNPHNYISNKKWNNKNKTNMNVVPRNNNQ